MKEKQIKTASKDVSYKKSKDEVWKHICNLVKISEKKIIGVENDN